MYGLTLISYRSACYLITLYRNYGTFTLILYVVPQRGLRLPGSVHTCCLAGTGSTVNECTMLSEPHQTSCKDSIRYQFSKGNICEHRIRHARKSDHRPLLDVQLCPTSAPNPSIFQHLPCLCKKIPLGITFDQVLLTLRVRRFPPRPTLSRAHYGNLPDM